MTQTVNGQTTGTIGVDGDNDWFKVSLTAGTQYVFDIGGGTLANSQLAVYDSAGNVINSSVTGNPAGGAQLVFEPTADGVYYIGASGVGNATGTYTLTQSTASFDFLGTTATAGTLAIGGTAGGTLSVAGQNDFYKVTLTAGTGYAFNISSASGAGLVSVYDSTGKYVVSGNDGDTSAGNTVFFVPSASGTYYIGASDLHLATGAFTLSAATASYDYAGNTATAGTVSVGGHVSGTLANVGQSDWFKVTLSAGTQYVFDVTSGGALIPSVSLYDANGNLVEAGYNGTPGGGARTSFEPTVSGTYYVAAGSVLSTTGAFTVNVSTATPDVLGTTATSGTLAVGGHTSGTLATAAQNDWYKISLTAGTGYEFTVGGGTLTGANVAVYDSTGKQLASETGQTFFDPTASGTYYIGAAGSNGSTGTFTVSAATAAFDHAGNINTTASVAVGGTATGILANAGQSDWFKVSLTAGTAYSFQVTGTTLGSPLAALYDSNGNLLTASQDGGTSFTPTTSGTYYVSASGVAGATGAFSVAVSAVSDDYAGNTSTTGTIGAALTVAKALSQSAAHTLPTGSTVVDTAANVQAGLATLEPLVAAGSVASIVLTDTSTPTITVSTTVLAADTPALQAINSAFTLSISGYSTAMSQFVQFENERYIPGTNHAGSDQAIEISSIAAGAASVALGSAYNTVIIDGDHSTTAAAAGQPDSFSFNVLADGTLTLLDNNTGHSQTITGATYLIFDAGASVTTGPITSFNSMYFIGGATNAQVTALYNAAFLRQPDLGGLEFYAKPIAAKTFDLHQAAVYFLNSTEFKNDYPTASLPSDNGGPNDQAFITTLYNNVLHRAPDAGGLVTYEHALSSGAFDRAALLEFFALSNENQTNISNLMVNTANGSYADSSALLSASSVLAQVSSNSALNLSAIDPTSIGTGVTANGITIDSSDTVTLTSSAPTETVHLSSTFTAIIVQNSGSSIFDAAGGSTITLSGAANTILQLTSGGGSDVVNLTGGTGTSVNAFVAGSGTVLNVAGITNPANLQILNGATTQVAGSGLTFGNGTAYVVEIGTVSDHTAATAAAAANHAYAATGAANETVIFLAQDSAGDTMVWSWATPTAGNASHTIAASGLVNIATIVGVAPTALHAADLG